MVTRISEGGAVYYEPPYTEEEEADFYRAVADGPVTTVRQKLVKPSPISPPRRPEE